MGLTARNGSCPPQQNNNGIEVRPSYSRSEFLTQHIREHGSNMSLDLKCMDRALNTTREINISKSIFGSMHYASGLHALNRTRIG